MDTKLYRLLAIFSVVALAIGACEIPSTTTVAGPTQIPADMIYTAAALTLQAQLTQNAPLAQGITPSLTPTDTPVGNTLTPLPSPSDTPMFTETPTMTLPPSATLTPLFPTISATIDTNCRKGPGPGYERLGFLLVGQTSEVFGRNSSSTWWYIRNPSNPSTYCWVWGESTTVSGDTASLPVLTPPPLPTSQTTGTPGTGTSFSASYNTVKKCGGVKHVVITIKNTGGKTLESMSIKSRDMNTDTLLSGPTSADKPFLEGSGDCPPGEDTLDAGKTAYVASSLGDSPVEDHEVKTTITLCTKEGLDGNCETVVVKFNIP